MFRRMTIYFAYILVWSILSFILFFNFYTFYLFLAIEKKMQNSHSPNYTIVNEDQIQLPSHSHLCTEQLIYISMLSKLQESAEISAVWYTNMNGIASNFKFQNQATKCRNCPFYLMTLGMDPFQLKLPWPCEDIQHLPLFLAHG